MKEYIKPEIKVIEFTDDIVTSSICPTHCGTNCSPDDTTGSGTGF